MRKNIFVLSLTFLAALGLTSCMLPEDKLPTCPPQEECPECPPTAPEIIVKQFTLTVQAGEGAEVKELTGLTEGKCESGSKITFKVSLKEHFLLDKVTLNEELLTADGTGTFSFRMPNADATLTIATLNLAAGGDLLTVSKLPADFAGPSTLDEFKATIAEANAVDGKFFKEATLKTTYEHGPKVQPHSGFKLHDFSIKAGINGVIRKEGVSGTAISEFLPFSSETFGTKNGYLYQVSETSDATKLTTKAETFKIVEDTTTELRDFEITTAEATSATTGYSYGEELLETYLGGVTNFKADATTVSTKVSETKDSFVVTISSASKFLSYVGQDFYELKATFDGDKFLTSAIYKHEKYAKESFDTEGKLLEGAIPSVKYTDTYLATRGYKEETLEEPNVESLLFKDYDVLTTCAVSGDTTYKLRNEGDLYIFGNTTFQFEGKGSSKSAIKPRVIGVSEGKKEAVLFDGQSVKFTEPGLYTLDFDDGLGTITKIKYNVLVPATKKVSGNFEVAKGFVGTPNKLTVVSIPEGSDSKVTITAKETSAPCDIVDNKDGTFNVTATTAGKVELDIVLDSNKEIKTTASFEAVEKPKYEDIIANITTQSLYKNDYGEKYYVNFNADGTGAAYYDYYGLDSTTTFKWTLDKETLAFTFTDFTYDGVTKFVDVKVVTATEFTGSFDYRGKVSIYNMTLTNRKTY